MENPEEVLHCLEEFSKSKPNDIPRELEDYLCFVAKTGDPVYQWSIIKCLLREKMIRVITEFYETCPSIEIPPCPNVDIFNYDIMKTFILEKLDTFSSAPFTVQRICELLTTPRKEYNRIDKYMRALEKNILVVSTTEPNGGRRNNTENGENIVNGLENDHLPQETSNDINVDEMDDTPPSSSTTQTTTTTTWSKTSQNDTQSTQNDHQEEAIQETVVTESKTTECSSSTTTTPITTQESVITCRNNDEKSVTDETNSETETTNVREDEEVENSDVSATITAIPAGVQKRRNSIEPVVSSESEQVTESTTTTTTVNEDSDNKIDDDDDDDSTRKVIIEESTDDDDESKDADSSSNIEINEIKSDKHDEIIKNDENDEKIINLTATTCSKTIEQSTKESCINDEITSSDKSINDDDNDVKIEKSTDDDNNIDSQIDNKLDKDDDYDDDDKEVSSTPMEVDRNDDDDDDDDSGDKTEIVDNVETTTTTTTTESTL